MNLTMESMPMNTTIKRWFPLYPTDDCGHDVQGEIHLELYYAVRVI